MSALRYRKKPVVVEAMQYDGRNGMEISAWSDAQVGESFLGGLEIMTPEGMMKASVGDWIIRGVAGEFYPCKPDIFAATYEATENIVGEDFPLECCEECGASEYDTHSMFCSASPPSASTT